jgi:hypothetical protein
MLTSLLLVAGLLTTPAVAQDGEAPEFLLGDVGVRLDMPSGWNMTRWSDWDFKAETTDKAVALFAWATPVQSPVQQADLEAWAALYEAKAEELGGSDAKATATRIEQHGGRDMVAVDVGFAFGNGAKMVMYGVTVPVEAQVFHVAVISTAPRQKRSKEALAEIADRLEVRKAPASFEEGATLSAAGVSTPLPPGFRTPLEPELAGVYKRTATLGVDKPEDCILAIRPHGPDRPDILITCQGGMWLGIVDSYTFDAKEAELRPHLFGRAEVPAAAPVELPDSTGFHYHVGLGDEALHVGVVPYDQGLARTWLEGPADRSDDFAEVLETVMKSSTYSGPHPVSLADRAGYLMYRPLWMAGVGAGGLVLLGGLAAGALALSRKRAHRFEDVE